MTPSHCLCLPTDCRPLVFVPIIKARPSYGNTDGSRRTNSNGFQHQRPGERLETIVNRRYCEGPVVEGRRAESFLPRYRTGVDLTPVFNTNPRCCGMFCWRSKVASTRSHARIAAPREHIDFKTDFYFTQRAR